MHPMKVNVQGFTRKARCGIPEQVVKLEVKSMKGQREVRGSVKDAMLQGDDDCPDLVASSIYNTKSAHILSMACNDLQ